MFYLPSSSRRRRCRRRPSPRPPPRPPPRPSPPPPPPLPPGDWKEAALLCPPWAEERPDRYARSPSLLFPPLPCSSLTCAPRALDSLPVPLRCPRPSGW
eukprot:4114126-Pyramimonas_sp.AAC.1